MTEKPTYEELEQKVKMLENAEKKLEQGEKTHRNIIETTNSGCWQLDVDEVTVDVNQALCKILGYSKEEIIGKKPFDFVNKDNLSIFHQNIARTSNTVNRCYDIELIRKDGKNVHTHFDSTTIFDSSGEISGSFAFVTDLTDTLQAQKKLRESEKKYQRLFENALEGIYQSTQEGKFINVNPAFASTLGYASPEEVISSISDIATQYFADPDEQHHFAMLLKKDGKVKNFEFKAKRKDGSHIWLSSNSRAVYDPDVKIVLYEGNDIDISERKRAEEAIRDSESKFRNLFEISPQAIAFTDVETGKLIDVNNTLCELTQYSKEEIIGRTTVEIDFYSDEDRKNFINELQSSGAVDGLEMKFKAKDGSILNALMFARIVEIFKKPQVLTIFLDITIQKQLESQLQQALKMESIGTLAGGIAHDFNNILFPIVGHTEMLIEDIPEDSPFRKDLNRIYTSALRAKDLVKQILTFSRQESGELKLIKIQPIIKEALKLIRSTIPATIDIKQYISSDCGIIKADPTQIHQIVMNLATNAYHAMEENGGVLKITLKEIKLDEQELITPDMTPGVYACLTIADTGMGMDKTLTDKIFDPYFTTKEKGKGTGMGLSVVHGIVYGMGGAIHVYSEPGKGTEFHVYLPIAEAVKEQQATKIESPIQGGAEHILLVDDEKSIIVMEQNMLERLGYKVTARLSSIEALEAFHAAPDKFDVIITDMAMPNMSGDKLAVELTKIRPDIPVLLCTGFSATMSEEKAASMGIRGFLLKPIVMKDLSQKIREVLDNSRT